MEPVFSIIIPTFNIENCIVECLQSIGAQTLNREKFELIVVDDCSSDDTCAKANEFLKNSDLKSEFRRHSANKGPGMPRNTGIGLAKGNFLLFVDGDDCLSANCLEELEKIVNEGPKHMDAIAYNWDYLSTNSLCDESSSGKGIISQRKGKPLVGQRRDLGLALLPQSERVKLFLGMGMERNP